ncbi:hypothetical protein QPK87_20675 [Kamptonema cortianum]|nr:hypothetical protein [Kamptonema cortianum]
MIRSAIRRSTLRQRLVLILFVYTLILVLLIGAVWASQFERRAITLTQEVLSAGITGALTSGQEIISAQSARSAANGDASATAELEDQLARLMELPSRTQIRAAVFVEEGAAGYRLVAGDPRTVNTPDSSAPTLLPFDVMEVDPSRRIAQTSVCGAVDPNPPEITLCVTADATWVFEGRDTIAQTLVLIGLAAVPVIILIAYLISRGLTTPLFRLIRAADALGKGEPYDPAPLRIVEEYGAELSSLARVFSRMAAEVQAREAALRAQVETLVIQIDQAKKQAQVSEITESDFFRDLQRKKDALRAGSATSTLPDPPEQARDESTRSANIDTERGAEL